MNLRKTSLILASVAALSPVIANASSERTSVKACAAAFATGIASSGSAVGYKLDYRGNMSGSLFADVYSSDYTFTLEARSKSGVPLARAVCTANSHGKVTAISAIPLDAQTAATAAQF
jgi:hypothetical protein